MNDKKQSRRKILGARFTSIISISLVLFILGIIAFMGVFAADLSTLLKENIGFTIVLNDEIETREINRLKTLLTNSDYAKAVTYISKEDAIKELTTELGENPEEFLGFNPLQASFEVKLNSVYANNDSIALIEKKVRAMSASVSEFNYRKDIVELINDNMRKAGVILFILAVILLLISFTLINNTVRLGIYSQRFLINTMRLVGATPGFIRRPFVRSNIVNGIIASFIAMGLLYGLINYINNEFQGFEILITNDLLFTVFTIVIILGIFITFISALFAANKYIRMNSDDMYLL